MKTNRRIIHIDMDCFYAAVEMRERPELANRPLAVGGSSERGVLTTCNYPARAYGVRSAMPVFKAKELCPQLLIVPVRFDLYRAASKAVREIFARYTDMIEPLSLDEAYLDVSHIKRPGSEIAAEIRATIEQEVGLTASAGIGPNKLIAKVASDWNKPNGQCLVAPSKVPLFMQTLPVRRIWGIGPKSSARLAAHGIETCAQLQTRDKTWLAQEFGSFGLELYDLCRGIDERPVQANRIRKSLSNERTFAQNLESLEECREQLIRQHHEMMEDLRKISPDRQIAKLLVKLKFSNFRRTTAEMPGQQPEIPHYLKLLNEAWGRSGEPVRLLGVGVRFAETTNNTEQLELGI
ncbi:DNA polymerase IV [Coraliomargarita sp. SDUM461004]|uniref:DNA polymerase IV n=1 Tax=Thalassobacterium sedimentorum TaxID=3041258 RepID=A0ABU1AL11_9BACT|nr:DNA polymerase IV [Coraliomargarita sp. SDUM461004]MDQ8195507.1 DNA polymerase IV [Coraliomargarita sp. SDUM461004]